MNDSILVVGIPRSGTTWLCEVISRCPDQELVLEPDNEKTSWLAWRLKRHLPRFPTLAIGEADENFSRLWDYAFRGRFARGLSRGIPRGYLKLIRARIEDAIVSRERAAAHGRPIAARNLSLSDRWLMRAGSQVRRRRVVKSVHVPFCSEWVADHGKPAHVVVLLRHPLGTIASMQRLEMDDAFRLGSLLPHLTDSERALVDSLNTDPKRDIRQTALQVFKMQQQVQDAARRNPHWITVRFEDLCASPIDGFRLLFQRIGLPWTNHIEAGIQSLNQAGSGYQTRRIAIQQIDSWKRELSAEDIKIIEQTFPQYLEKAESTVLLSESQ